MDIKVKRRTVKAVVAGSLAETYPHDLQMYRVPPIGNISLSEFESLAIERLKILRILATVSTLKGHRLYSEEWKEAIYADVKTEGLKHYIKLLRGLGQNNQEADLQTRRSDHISHFILRLAYCRSEELRRWFITRELELFKMRFQSLTSEGVSQFFKSNNLNYVPINEYEKSELLSSLCESTAGLSHVQVEKYHFYKVKFSEVFDLVRNRKVFIMKGYAYIPHTEFVSVLCTQFRAHLKQSLAVASRWLPEVEHDERLVSLLKGLHHSYTGNDYTNGSKAVVPIESLDSLSLKSFPLCMRQLHEHLRSAHHMKHGGRIQYGLFLKGIGVTLEDSLRFWREEFTKLIDLDKFEKQYAYNIRYNYGKEGSRKNYSPFSCMKIIQGSVGPGDCHGCPFRHSDDDVLKNKLQGYGLDSSSIAVLSDMAKKGHYQIACSKYFDVVHNVKMELGINHPNQYFEESQNVIQDLPNAVKSIKLERPTKKTNNETLGMDQDWDDEAFDEDMEKIEINKEIN